MWLLDNATPFAADTAWTRDENGAETWLTVIKATFQVGPDGKQTLAETQRPVALAPVFDGGGDDLEVIEETDLNIAKARTDVLVAGHAHAPKGGAAETECRLKLADIDKRIRVIGDRRIGNGPVGVALSPPRPFQKVPLTWRRTYGGWDRDGDPQDWVAENPIGTGFATDTARLDGARAPNFEYPDVAYSGPGRGRPAGVGPVARHWRPRVRYAGTYDETWEITRNPLPPRDFDRQFYQCAPADQQTAKPLVGYEHVRLGQFTEDGFWQFVLPRVTFNIVTQFYRRPDRRHDPVQIHTLTIHPDTRQFTLVWMSVLPVPFDEERLKETRVSLRPRVGTPASVARSGVWMA